MKPRIKILFVCLGNICRSTMAEFVFKDMVRKEGIADKFEIASAATSNYEIGNDTHIGTKKKLTEMGIPFEKRSAVQITKADYDYYDYIIVMDESNIKNLEKVVGADTKNKVSMLLEHAGERRDIADPWFTGNFDETYDDVSKGCACLMNKLKANVLF